MFRITLMETSSLKVLVVEDEKLHADMYAERLQQVGFEPLIASTGDEGLEMAKQRKPAAIILDILLPGMNGFLVLQKLKDDETTRDIPVIIATNLETTSAERRGTMLGAAGFVVKAHTTPKEIVDGIVTILKKRGLLKPEAKI